MSFQHSKWCLFAAGEEVSAQDCHIGKACGMCTVPELSTIKLKGSCKQDKLKEEEKEWFDTGVKRNFLLSKIRQFIFLSSLDFYVYGQMNGRPHFRYISQSHNPRHLF